MQQVSAMANVATLMEAGRCGSDCEHIAQVASDALSAAAAHDNKSNPTTPKSRSNQDATALAVVYWRWRAAMSGSSYLGAR